MQYVVKNEIEPKVSLVILLGKMEDDNYSGFHSELNHLLEKDHSLVFDCNALNEINTPGIQALSALSSKAKGFSNIAAFFGLSNRVRQNLEEAGVLESLLITPNNFEAMKMAKKLQPQKEELRKVQFGRPQNIPKSEQNPLPEETEEKKQEQPTHEESSLYQHIKSQAEEAVRWEKILDDKLDDGETLAEEPPTVAPQAETPPQPEPQPEPQSEPQPEPQPQQKTAPAPAAPQPEQPRNEEPAPKIIPSPAAAKPPTPPIQPSPTAGVTQHEKELLFDEPPAPAQPIERGVSLAEKEDLFSETTEVRRSPAPRRAPQRPTRELPSDTATLKQPQQSLLMPILFGLLLIVGVLNIFKEPIQHALLSPETLDTMAQNEAESALKNSELAESSPEDSIELPSETIEESSEAVSTALPATPPAVNAEPPLSDKELLSLVATITLPKRLSAPPLATQAPSAQTTQPDNASESNALLDDEINKVLDLPTASTTTATPSTQEVEIEIDQEEIIIPDNHATAPLENELPRNEQHYNSGINQPASIDAPQQTPPQAPAQEEREAPVDIDPGLFQ